MSLEAGVVGLVWFFFQPTRQDLGSLALPLFALCAIAPALTVIAPVGAVAFRRFQAYEHLFQIGEARRDRLASAAANEELIRQLIGYLRGIQMYAPTGLMSDGTGLHLLIPNEDGALNVGTQLIVFRLSTEEFLGQFNVSSLAGMHAVVSAVRLEDALWWGALRQEATMGRLGAPDDVAAIIMNGNEARS